MVAIAAFTPLASKESQAATNRRLGYPQDFVIGRWVEGGEETFDKEVITDPEYPGTNRTVKEYKGQYKYAPAGRKLLIIVHIIGISYMLIGLNTVCDIYFCGALDEMVEAWQIPPDVAGATLMAAGGSAPELFTSLIGAVIVESDVGFSTIVGSAVFNVLAVIGCCGMAAHEPIKLSWWPLFRDCTFYIFSLAVLAIFARGNTYGGDTLGPDGQKCLREKCGSGKIFWYQALILFFLYLLYILIAKYNERLQAFANGYVEKFSSAAARTSTTKVEPIDGASNVLPEAPSKPSVQKPTEVKPTVRSSEPALRQIPDSEISPPAPQSSSTLQITGESDGLRKHRHHGDPDFIPNRFFRKAAHHAHMAVTLAKNARKDEDGTRMSLGTALAIIRPSPPGAPASLVGVQPTVVAKPSAPKDADAEKPTTDPDTKEDNSSVSSEATDDIQALISPPDEGFREILLWALCLPVCAPMYFLIPRPDTRFLATFGVALLFIAFYSYWLVYCVQIFSDTILCSFVDNPDGVNVVMGFTLLAAGTSIPDLVSSMVVARAGEGDMAVSSSIGSNIFDILVGLPIPWMLKSFIEIAIEGDDSFGVPIKSPYIAIYVLLLLIMVTAVIVSIVVNRWFLNKQLGIMMSVLYVVFLAIVIPLELFEYL